MDEQQGRQKIFITGGAGFIGANLVKYLLEREGLTVTLFDNLSTGSKTTLHRAIRDSGRNMHVEFIQGDIIDFEALSKAVQDHDIVIHLAAHTRVVESIEDPRENFAVNSVGTFNVVEAARKNKIKRLIFASSNAAVGEQIPPINEKMIPKPASPYGASKLYGESLCLAYFHSYGLKTVALRFANVYGPYSDHKTSVVAKFLRRAKQGEHLEIYGDGNQTRDFIFVEDLCRVILLLLDSQISGEVFQIATGVETRILELAALVRETVDQDIGVQHGAPRQGDIQKNYSAIGKAKKVLGWSPKVNLDTGLHKTWDWFQEHV